MTTLVEDIWAYGTAGKLMADIATLSEAVSKRDARGVFARAGFGGDALAIALGVSYAESEGYSDAVGDLTLINMQWGPSIGLFQVRSLRNPLGFGTADRYRFAWALRDPDFNAVAAFAISKQGTDWSPWSTFRSGGYQARLGVNYTIRTGHVHADDWGK